MLLECLKQSGEHHGTLRVATQKRREAAPGLGRNIVERSKRARGKESFAGSPEPSCSTAILAHKLLHQRGFADPGLPAYQHRAPMAGRGRAQELGQLMETGITFEKVHRASSASSRDLRTKIPWKKR